MCHVFHFFTPLFLSCPDSSRAWPASGTCEMLFLFYTEDKKQSNNYFVTAWYPRLDCHTGTAPGKYTGCHPMLPPTLSPLGLPATCPCYILSLSSFKSSILPHNAACRRIRLFIILSIAFLPFLSPIISRHI